MGSNEHGVVIGNGAVVSKIPYGKEDGLIRMDFLHLGLEQSATARDALPWHFNRACKGFNHQTGLTSEWDYASENLYKDVLK
ncbi:MAG: hypothetical protein MUO64_20275 [Anaerolineales bacterium]|nr:hypothetical protein [Anaerolineales bacterium]